MYNYLMTNPFPHLRDEQEADDYSLSVTSTPDAADVAELKKQIQIATWDGRTAVDTKDIGIFIKDKENKLIAGLCGRTKFGWLYVDQLWVSMDHQKQGIGSKLLRGAEKEAKRRGCKAVHLISYEFALPFYLKHGYSIFGELDDYPETHSRYYLMKRFK